MKRLVTRGLSKQYTFYVIFKEEQAIFNNLLMMMTLGAHDLHRSEATPNLRRTMVIWHLRFKYFVG